MDKVFCDPVHGQISFPPLCVEIIDTFLFQRLRHIKQLGFVSYVYPGGVNTRFEHSLGVGFLARKFMNCLKLQQPELEITEKQILCVEVAGLCHDLGHGPFSHFWEKFIHRADHKEKVVFKHEDLSLQMVDYLLKDKLKQRFEKLKKQGEEILSENDIEFIKKLILGKNEEDSDHHFLYQIINNEDSGLDVDKWDYFMRDCHYVGLKCNFDYNRLIFNARVIRAEDGKQHICFRDKAIHNISDMFKTRSDLHTAVYQHKKVLIVERMMTDALVMAFDKLSGPDGDKMNLVEITKAAVKDGGYEALEKYAILIDSVLFYEIRNSKRPDLLESKKLLVAVEERSSTNNFYKLVDVLDADNTDQKKNYKDYICEQLSKIHGLIPNKECHQLVKLETMDIHWGKKELNPLDYIFIFEKHHPNQAVPLSKMKTDAIYAIPEKYRHIKFLVLTSKMENEFIDALRNVCKRMKKESKIYTE
ncbi:deoxynucleoside triphosphate triphosphohydrolase SAMHD1-like isoform X3 [Limulus polyphemus]|nr:deoxynucleoside triphosphate triphosphohydrolase SAMHD1-like isoform X3 [Limulus polyphemus]